MSTTKKTNSNGVWSINKIAFYCVCIIAIMYLLSAILSLCSVNLKIISAIQGFATAILICLASYLAWKYVSGKTIVWKVLYFVCLLVVVLGIVLPLI